LSRSERIIAGRSRAVDVPLPDAGLLGQLDALVQVGQRAQRLGGDLPGVREHRQLASSRRDHVAVHEQVVAQVDVRLERREALLAHRVQAEHRLQPVALAVLQRGEAELAADPHEDHAAGHADLVVRLCPGLEVGVRGTDLRDGVRARDADGVGLLPGRQEPLALLPPDADLLGGVVGGGLLRHRTRITARAVRFSRRPIRAVPGRGPGPGSATSA
jgi:hypothetical protein